NLFQFGEMILEKTGKEA
nr:RecName: Full=Phospholipase A2 1; Short=PLA21; Short=svPLA2; AltName: Full=Phosphatidylcholine 2-acylhydrolase [Daboia russelii]